MDFKIENGRVYYKNEKNELLAEITYVMNQNGEANINHTYVNPALRGQGVASEMMETISKYFREKSVKTTASCSYANSWLKKNFESYSDIISDDFDCNGVSCGLDRKDKK